MRCVVVKAVKVFLQHILESGCFVLLVLFVLKCTSLMQLLLSIVGQTR